jgi:AcrR family transcriptional regulator
MTDSDGIRRDTRESLLDAAEQIFAEKGFAGSSVREITARASVNLGAITYHFGSKAALFEAVIARAQQALVARLEAAAWGPGAPLDRIEAVARAHVEFMASRPNLRRLVMQVLLSGAAIPEAAAAQVRRAMGVIASLIARGQIEGQVRPGDPQQLTIAVMAQPIMLNVLRGALRAGPNIDLDDPTIRTEMLDNAARFIRAGLSRPAAKGE